MRLYWRRRDADSIGLFHFGAEMGSEHYNNPFTRMVYRRSQNSPAMMKRMRKMMDRQVRPQDMIQPHRLLGWLLAESVSGNWAAWSSFGHSLRFGRQVIRQQAVLDRALAKAERGHRNDEVPSLQ